MTPKKQSKKKVAKKRSKKAVRKKAATKKPANRKTKQVRKKAAAKKPPPPDLVSIAELARRVGVTRRAVEQAIEDGRIIKAVVQRSSGNGKPWKIDSAKAIRLWKLGTNTTHRPMKELEDRAKKAKGNATLDPSPEDQDIEPFEEEESRSYYTSRARKEAAVADLKEMEVEEERGELLRRSKVEKAIFQVVRTQREAFQSMPARLAGELATMDDPGEIERFLAEDVRRVLEEAAEHVKGITDNHKDVA